MNDPGQPMSDGRAQILAAIRHALGTAARPARESRAIHEQASRSPAGARALVELFCERAKDYRAAVTQVDANDVANEIAAAAARHRAQRLVIPREFPAQWRPAQLELIEDDCQLTARELEEFDGALTAAGGAIAATGTLVLDGGPDQGRRALTLLPDLHICVVPAGRVVADLADAIAVLDKAIHAERRPVTLVSGPSATSDIELRRVEGVHGPRRLEIIVAAVFPGERSRAGR
jgi:L-lactate dehydrogenase complex protein LldG